MSGYRSPWAVLGITQTNDDRAIRKAYSAKLKQIDVEADPAAFIALRQAMEQARQQAAWHNEREEQQDEDQFDNGFPPPGDRPDPAFSKLDTAPETSLADDGSIWLAHRIAPALFVPLLQAEGVGSLAAAPLPPVADVPQYSDLESAAQVRKAKRGKGAPLHLPHQAVQQVFPFPTPLLVDLLRVADPETQADPVSSLVDEAPTFTPIGGTDMEPPARLDADSLYPSIADEGAAPEPGPEPETPPQPESPRDEHHWANMKGTVSIVRDDWGEADRLKLEALYYHPDFGWEQAIEAEEVARRLLGSDHLDRIDYRDWMENWAAALISQTLPRSDGLLKIASRAFGWGTDAGQLHHSAAVDACISRNRDLASIEALRSPSHKWHKIFALLQQPAPAKLPLTARRRRKDVQQFLDSTRIERPTLEWELNAAHVRLWDDYINGAISATTQPTAKFKWYHGLIIAFMVLQLFVRFIAGPDTSVDAQAPKSALDLVDYESQARAKNRVADLMTRDKIGKKFNAALRADDDYNLSAVHQLDSAVNISSYIMLADIEAYLGNSCDEDCNFRIVKTLSGLARTTVTLKYENAPLAPTAPPPPPPIEGDSTKTLIEAFDKLPPAQREKLMNDLRSGKYKDFGKASGTSSAGSAPPPVPALPPPSAPLPPISQRTYVPLKWSYSSTDASIPPKVEHSKDMKKLGFTEADIAALSKRLVQRTMPDNQVEWTCSTSCKAYVDYVLRREERAAAAK